MCKSTSRGKQIVEMSVEGGDFVENAARVVEMSTTIVTERVNIVCGHCLYEVNSQFLPTCNGQQLIDLSKSSSSFCVR